jgi:hypothetical protein
MKLVIAVTLAAAVLTLSACGSTNEDGADVTFGTNPHVLPFRDPGAPATRIVPGDSPASGPADNQFALAPAATPHLTYWGGPVMPNVSVIKVQYGAGTYPTFVTGTGASTLGGFFTGVTASPYFDWLTEYDTPSQTVGRGSYAGATSITPAASRNRATISDASIQAELNAQISAGTLPTPDVNTIYFVFFPKGKRISLGTSRSCVAGGFCAYHGTFVRNGVNAMYAVMPDASAGSGCDVGCGSNATPFNNVTSVASHELIEAVTDPAVGIASVFGPPLGWYDQANGEIGDICNAQQGTVLGGNGVSYVVQKEWSNTRSACVAQ